MILNVILNIYIFCKRRNSKGAGGNFGKVWYVSGFDDSNGFIGVYLSSKFISLCLLSIYSFKERERERRTGRKKSKGKKKNLLMKLENKSLVGYPINN